MSNPGDFIVEDGTLKKYVGSDQNVVIPEGVRHIGAGAFQNNTDLISVSVPDSVISIDGRAFRGAFAGCSSLRQLKLPTEKIAIGDDAFAGCHALADENGLVIFYNMLFASFAGAAAVTVPEGVTQIRSAFFQNHHVTAVILPESLGAYERRYFQLAKKTNLSNAFYDCINLETVRLPEGIAWIPGGMFQNCGKLRELHLPDSVQGMDLNALSGCRGLQLIAGRNVRQITEDRSGNSLGCFGGNAVMVCPRMPLRDVFSGALKVALTMGFFQNQELYAPEIAEEYRKYACRERLYLLQRIFRLDLVEALVFYDRNRKIKSKDFEKEWMEPAEEAGAIRCKAWLLDWRSRHKLRKDPLELTL